MLLVVAGATLFGVGAAAQEEAFVEDVQEVTATLTAIEPESRLVSLETSDGREMTVEVGDDVRNFDQLEVGDRVDLLFYEALAAEVTDAPAGADQPAVIASRRAPLGERPGGSLGMVYTAVVTIDDVDPQTHTVTFTGPNGQRELTVERPEMQEFIAGLSAGDRVQVTYGEAFAVAVNPAE